MTTTLSGRLPLTQVQSGQQLTTTARHAAAVGNGCADEM